MYYSKIKKIATVLLCSLAVQPMAFAETSNYPTVKNLTIDTFDEVIKWDYDGDYQGVEVYKVSDTGELTYFGKTDASVVAYSGEGTYLVKPVNGADDDYGSIITYSKSSPFSLTLNDIGYSDKSVTMDISVTNNTDSYSGGLLSTEVRDVEGNTISESENSMIIKPEKSSRLKITQPIDDTRYKITISFKSSEKSENDLASPIVIVMDDPSVDYTEEVILQNDRNAAEILALINRCKEQNIPTDYEYANYQILKRFSEYLKEDIKSGEFSRVYYTENALKRVYSETVSNLNAYLSGEKTAEPVPKYNTSDMRIEGETLYASATTGDGTVEERPMYFMGYGHFDTAKEEIELFEDLGMNTMQIEIGPSNAMLYTPCFEKWGVEETGTPSYTLTKDTTDFKEGTASAKLTFSSEAGGKVRLYQKVKVEPGKEYTFLAYVRSDTKATGIAITADGFETTLNSNGQYGWKKVTKSYTAPSDAVYTTVGFEITSDADIYIDNASFTENGSDVNLLENSGFETASDFEYSFDRYSENVISVEDALKRAEENNIAVCVLLSPHYFPKLILEKYDIGFENGTAFIKYNINAPEAKKVVEIFMRGIIPVIKQYDSLNSICISNEPSFEIDRASEYYFDEWQEFLKERYDNDITKLNETYKNPTPYSSFEEVGIGGDHRYYYNYDYVEFNVEIFSEWHRWMAEISKEEAPNVPIHSKLMGYLTANSKDRNTYFGGVDLAKYHDFFDLNGCDYNNYIDNEGKFLAQEMWYDYMRSVKTAPVINSEDHILPNGDKNYDAEVADYVAQNLYMGAIHGRGMSDIWVWERTYDDTSKFADSLLLRPDVISAVSKTAMDLNKNAYQINALQTKKADIGILYSKSSVMLDKNALNSLYQAYSACIFSGLKPGFVISSQLEKLNNYETVIVPDTKYVTPEILTALADYSGKLVMLGEDCLKYDDKRIENDKTVVSNIYQNSEVVDFVGLKNNILSSSETEFYAAMREVFENQGLCNVEVRDTATGKPVEYVQINIGNYDGKMILNMVSYEGKKNVDIYVDGTKIERAYNIITNENVTEFTLDKYIPMTLEIDS